LLALEPAELEQLRRRHPGFERLLQERIAQYRHTGAARVPLDFADEVLPAETRVADKTAGAEEAGHEEQPFEQGGHFRKKGRIRGGFPYVEPVPKPPVFWECILDPGMC
jgi:hypothetical protein